MARVKKQGDSVFASADCDSWPRQWKVERLSGWAHLHIVARQDARYRARSDFRRSTQPDQLTPMASQVCLGGYVRICGLPGFASRVLSSWSFGILFAERR
jgi:hypothetical protein